MMHSGTPETGQKSKFFDLFSQENVTNSLKSYFWYCGVCLKLIAARKRQLHYNPALSQWHFVVVFCQFRQKSGFFMQNVFQKELQRPFWLSLHYVA